MVGVIHKVRHSGRGKWYKVTQEGGGAVKKAMEAIQIFICNDALIILQ